MVNLCKIHKSNFALPYAAGTSFHSAQFLWIQFSDYISGIYLAAQLVFSGSLDHFLGVSTPTQKS